MPVLKRFDCIKLAWLPKVASARGLSIVCMCYFSCQAINNTSLKFLNVNGVNGLFVYCIVIEMFSPNF